MLKISILTLAIVSASFNVNAQLNGDSVNQIRQDVKAKNDADAAKERAAKEAQVKLANATLALAAAAVGKAKLETEAKLKLQAKLAADAVKIVPKLIPPVPSIKLAEPVTPKIVVIKATPTLSGAAEQSTLDRLAAEKLAKEKEAKLAAAKIKELEMALKIAEALEKAKTEAALERVKAEELAKEKAAKLAAAKLKEAEMALKIEEALKKAEEEKAKKCNLSVLKDNIAKMNARLEDMKALYADGSNTTAAQLREKAKEILWGVEVVEDKAHPMYKCYKH